MQKVREAKVAHSSSKLTSGYHYSESCFPTIRSTAHFCSIIQLEKSPFVKTNPTDSHHHFYSDLTMPASSMSRRQVRVGQADHVHLELESVLRLRPLLKKEKLDQVVLEPRRLEDGRPSTAVLHPMMATMQNQPESPAMKMLSPESLQFCRDTEYHLGQILAEESDQEKVFYSLGLPIARESMDFLKWKKSAKGLKKCSNLIVCMGVENSGKTHTCFGPGRSIPKRRCEEDGLVPRILDSLFSQSKHHVKNRKNLSFGVQMTLIQVTQQITEQPKHDDDSVVQDLLLAKQNKADASPMRSPSPSRLASVASVKSLVATMERAKGTVTASVTGRGSLRQESTIPIEQDTTTMDFSTNATIKTCRDATEARQWLSSGLHAGQKLCPRGYKAHVLTVLHPVLFGSDGSIEREGSKIGILDMAGIEQSSQKKRNTAVRRHKDSIGASSSSGTSDAALNSLMHCVRSLQHNSMILSGKTPNLDIVDGSYDCLTIDDNASELSCVSQEKTGRAKGPTFKMIPYRQHSLTMVLQPFFSARQTSTTKLILLMAAYPGHRDHAEKKALLNDLELLFEVEREPEVGAAITGFEKRPLSPIAQYSPSSACNDEQSFGRFDEHERPIYARELDQDRNQEKVLFPSAPTVDVSMAYSMDEDEDVIPMPPPFAPQAPTAPVMEASHPPANASHVVDFPGVVLPEPTPKESPYETPRSLMPHPQDNAERSLEKELLPRDYTRLSPRNQHGLMPHPQDIMERSFDKSPLSKKSGSPRNEQPLKTTTSHNVRNKGLSMKSETTKAWLTGLSGTTKSAINHVVKSSTKTGIKMMDRMRTTPERSDFVHRPAASASVPQQSPKSPRRYDFASSPRQSENSVPRHQVAGTESSTHMKSDKMGTCTVVQRRETKLSKASTSNSATRKSSKPSNTNDGGNDATRNQLKKLEMQNKGLINRNRELEVKCANLSAENVELKRRLGVDKQKPWNKAEEEAWQKTRSQFAAPPLIEPTLDKHLQETKQVFETSGRYNFAVGRPQFSLKMPSDFQRASVLNRRDQNEDRIFAKPSDESCVTESSGEKRKDNVTDFQKAIESVKRRRSFLFSPSRT